MKALKTILSDYQKNDCADLSKEACQHQRTNAIKYLISNTASKIADELSSAKLMLPWLLSSLGAGTGLIAFIVPIRESAVLIPQLLIAQKLRQFKIHKYIWVLGAVIAGFTLAGIAGIALMQPAYAPELIITLLIAYSLARGICSVSSKDVLGKTIAKKQRGKLMGYATTLSSLPIFILASAALLMGIQGGPESSITWFFFAAAILWGFSTLAFSRIREPASEIEKPSSGIADLFAPFGILKSDGDFRRFIVARSFLLSTALLPPFIVVAMQESLSSPSIILMLAISALGSTISGAIWGKLSDRSSKTVMILSCLLTLICSVIAFTALQWMNQDYLKWLLPGVFFILSVSHAGARLGRKTYLVDLANNDNRADYVAVSNTVLGIVILFSGGLGAVATFIGIDWLILILGLVSLAGIVFIYRIQNIH